MLLLTILILALLGAVQFRNARLEGAFMVALAILVTLLLGRL